MVKTRLATDECLVPRVEFVAPNRFEYSSDKTPASDELLNRINLIASLDNSWVIKEFVFDSFDFSEILHLADRIYVLTRDRSERILSAVFSHSFNIFNVQQARVSAEFAAFRNTGVKFTIPKETVDLFIAQQGVFEKFEPPKTEKVQILDFSDLVKCTTNKEFCQLLNLPIVDFNFVSKTKELDIDKFEMIENLDEVKAWITSYLN